MESSTGEKVGELTNIQVVKNSEEHRVSFDSLFEGFLKKAETMS